MDSGSVDYSYADSVLRPVRFRIDIGSASYQLFMKVSVISSRIE